MRLATAAQMRELDRQAIEEHNIPSIDLMERAAADVAEAALSLIPEGKGRAAVFCGPGNNGGDGVGAARILIQKGVRVRVFLVGDPDKRTPDTREELRRLSGRGGEAEPFDGTDAEQRLFVRSCQVIVDALFGVGLRRDIAPDSPYAAAIRLINDSQRRVVAADISSGVEADTGRILGCAVRADRTVTFTALKIGHAVGDGALYSGRVSVCDIGIPAELQETMAGSVQTAEADTIRRFLPPRKPDGHKGDFGKLLIIGGSVGYTGAPFLTASAAVHTGCGLVFLGVPGSVWTVEAAKCDSAMPFPLPTLPGSPRLDRLSLPDIRKRLESCDVLALGPGLGRSGDLTRLAGTLLRETDRPVVLDADGINALEGHIDVLDARRDRVTILTPHDGEFTRIGGTLEAGRAEAARRFAGEHGCVLVLKGHRTVTASPEGEILVNTTGNSGLAKGGSGDVLTGIIASLLAQGATPFHAAGAGVWMHGRAGDLAADALSEYAMTPRDVIALLSKVFRELKQRGENPADRRM